MITVRVCTVVGASPDEVWRAVEQVERHTDWMRDAETITVRGTRREGVGAEFECRTRVGPFRTTDRFVVTRWDPGVAMGISHCGAVTGDGEFELNAWGDGATQFCWTERLRFPWWMGGRVGERVGRPVLRRVWRGNLARLERAVTADRSC